jgi:hypothetical protein
MQALEREIKSVLSKGLIEPSTAAYGALALFVTKKPIPGTPPGAPVELRMVIDFRKLNALTVPNRGTIPRIDDMYDSLSGAKVFTSLNLASGDHQLRIAEEDVPKTSFRTPEGLLC